MNKIDVVIVSDAKTKALYDLTWNTIRTAQQDAGVHCIVVEKQTSVNYAEFPNTETHYYDFDFNYNKCLNWGAAYGTAEYIAFCNNDLRFQSGWTRIIDNMKRYHIRSASPICPRTAREYNLSPNSGMKFTGTNVRTNEVRMMFAGWCFVWERSLWQKLGGHDERRKFWTADNASLIQLKRAGLRHGLDTTVVVDHLQSQTLQTLDKATRDDYEWNEARKFNKDYNQNLFNLGT